jgi:hypothetical protein
MDILCNAFPSLSPGGIIISHELFAERDFEQGQLKPTIGPAKALNTFFSERGISYQAMPMENGSGLVVPCQPGEQLQLSCAHVQFLRDRCRSLDAVLARQQSQAEYDIRHWQNEVDKLMKIYRATADFKLKQAVKGIFSVFGLYRKN